MNLLDAVTLLVSLLVLLNPVSLSAAYMSMTKSHSQEELRSIPFPFTVAITIIMLISVWFGQLLLQIFGVTLPAFQLAGGLVLLMLGLGMIFPKTTEAGVSVKKANSASIAVVPLAIPLGAGPGVIAFLIENSERFNTFLGKTYLSIICLIICVIAGVILHSAPIISKRMGETGIQTMSRVAGLIIASLGAEMLARATNGFFPNLH